MIEWSPTPPDVIAHTIEPGHQIRLEWASDDTQTAMVSRYLLEEMVAEINEYRRIRAANPRCDHDWLDLGPLERPNELRYCPRCGASQSLTES